MDQEARGDLREVLVDKVIGKNSYLPTYTCLPTFMHTCMYACMHAYNIIHTLSYRPVAGGGGSRGSEDPLGPKVP